MPTRGLGPYILIRVNNERQITFRGATSSGVSQMGHRKTCPWFNSRRIPLTGEEILGKRREFSARFVASWSYDFAGYL